MIDRTYKKVSDMELIEAYGRLKSVWKVAKIFGMCGQSVWERLNRREIIAVNPWTEVDDNKLKELYKNYDSKGICINEIAKIMTRTRWAIANRANHLGITQMNRPKTEEQIQKQVKLTKDWMQENNHPKGMLGKKHSEETKKILATKSKQMMDSWTKEDFIQRAEKTMKTKRINGTLNAMRFITNPYSRTKSGKREDINNIYFRSAVEANYARYLTFTGVKWIYEPKDFYFENIRRGCVSYTPDFYLPEENRWIEVKGWFDAKSLTKLNRFKLYYPQEFVKLTLVIQSRKALQIAIDMGIPYEDYREISKKIGGLIPLWE